MHPRMKTVLSVIFCLVLIAGSSGLASALTYTPISFSYNANLNAIGGDTYPVGNQTFLGVPFSIPATGNNIWHSNWASGSNPRTLTISVNIAYVTEVDTIINTYWGVTGTHAYLEFFGSDGAYYKKDLYGNVDIRDYNNDGWTNSINGTTTRNIVSLTGGQHRLDMQTITLPTDFADETLQTIVLSDSGAINWQRTFLAGVTVGAVPLPATLPLVATGLLGLWGLRRWGRS